VKSYRFSDPELETLSKGSLATLKTNTKKLADMLADDTFSPRMQALVRERQQRVGGMRK
jgi:hypothetical protein